MDTLYGHQEAISSFSCGPTNRLLTGGEDKTIRIWKVEESTQLVFRYYICVVLCIVYSCYVNNIIHVNCRLCNTINKPICSSVLLYCILIVVDVVVVVVVVIVVLLYCIYCTVSHCIVLYSTALYCIIGLQLHHKTDKICIPNRSEM